MEDTERQFVYQLIEKLLTVNHELALSISQQNREEPNEKRERFENMMQIMMLKMVNDKIENSRDVRDVPTPGV